VCVWTDAINHRQKKRVWLPAIIQKHFWKHSQNVQKVIDHCDSHPHKTHLKVLIATLLGALFHFILQSQSWKLTSCDDLAANMEHNCNMFAKLLKNSILFLIFLWRKGKQWRRFTNKEKRVNDNIVLHLLHVNWHWNALVCLQINANEFVLH
jgi:hypothetical protein